jgi:hypothetical protein
MQTIIILPIIGNKGWIKKGKILERHSDGLFLIGGSPLFEKLVVNFTALHTTDQIITILQVQRIL